MMRLSDSSIHIPGITAGGAGGFLVWSPRPPARLPISVSAIGYYKPIYSLAAPSGCPIDWVHRHQWGIGHPHHNMKCLKNLTYKMVFEIHQAAKTNVLYSFFVSGSVRLDFILVRFQPAQEGAPNEVYLARSIRWQPQNYSSSELRNSMESGSI
jgi:hypothetical protein